MVAAFLAGQTIPELDLGDVIGQPMHQQVAASTVAVDDEFHGTVTRIVDGDTFWISSADVRIRVWALDAPERDAPGFDAATEAFRRLIDGRTLTCRTRDIDRFGRIVGQCFLPDGRDITRAMIDTGTAREFCRFSGNHYGTCGQ
jgi:endonuclease YncB( thermonuclease family)